MKNKPPARQTHYDALKVAPDAPVEVIRAAYRSLSQKYHPDRNADGAESVRVMAALNQAYEVLSHPLKKQEYDAWMREEETRASGSKLPSFGRRRALVAKRKRPASRRWLRPARVWQTVTVLACCGVAALYASGEKRDSWLEQAWHESWRGENAVHTAPASALNVVSFGRSAPAAAPLAAVPGLKWENSLRKDAPRDSGDARF